MKRLAVIGAGGHGTVIADIAEQLGWSVEFYDDAYPQPKYSGAWEVLGTSEYLKTIVHEYDSVFVAVGNNMTRATLMSEFETLGCKFTNLIHPQAIVSTYAQISLGSVVMPGAVVNAYALVGKGCIINTSAVIEHECQLSDYVHISPKAALAGGVSIGRCSWVGMGATIIQNIEIEQEVVVGAGALVIKNITNSLVVGGVPAIELVIKK